MNAPHFALCLEQTLGHRAHTLTLEREAANRAPRASVLRVEYPEAAMMPVPWAVRGSARARSRLRALDARPDITLFHTSTIALAAPSLRRPYAVSVDATPMQLDTMGAWYAHRRMPGLAEAAKRRWYSRVFAGARLVVAWSRWSAASLASDYGVEAGRILVAHPGAPAPFFAIERPRRDVPTILFVGGDFPRKGGDDLLAAFAPLKDCAKLLLVTGADVPMADGVEVVRNATPGSAALLDAYRRADIFCLPTRGDCTSVAIEEAMAAGLPIVTTPVGSNADTVPAGLAGTLVRPGDRDALEAALRELIDDADLRRRRGGMARALARESYDAGANAARVIDALEAAA